MAGSQIESSLDGWPIAKVAEFLNLSKSTLYIWSCHDQWGGKYPPAPKGSAVVWCGIHARSSITGTTSARSPARSWSTANRFPRIRKPGRRNNGAGVALSKVHAGTPLTNQIQKGNQ